VAADDGRRPMIRVLVADDQPIVRAGLRMILDAQPDLEVVGEAADGFEAVRLAERLHPDVGLFDIRMPGLDGIEATRRLAGAGVVHPLAIVVITTFDVDDYVHAALKAGARGFLLKDSGAEQLAHAVHAAHAGDSLIDPALTLRLLEVFRAKHGAGSPVRPTEPLTAREEQVLRDVARGLTNAEIGADLMVSLGTVKAHLGSIMLKLGARNRVELAMWAYDTGRVTTGGAR